VEARVELHCSLYQGIRPFSLAELTTQMSHLFLAFKFKVPSDQIGTIG
jgi:hypothetical protein